jgi:hypothetical protein
MKRRTIEFLVVCEGKATRVAAKTAGAAARRAFRQLIRTPKRRDGRSPRPNAPLKRQPDSELDGSWKDTLVVPVA